MTRWLTLFGITLQTSPPPLRPSGSRAQYFVRPALASHPPHQKNPLTRGCMTAPSPSLTPSGQQRGLPLRRKRRLHAVQVSQQLITTTPPVLRRKCVVSRWKKGKEIMKHEAQASSIPALKSNDGAWVLDAQGKAVTFAGKCKLPRLCHNSYTVCTQCPELQTSVVCPSVEQCWLASVTMAPLVPTSCLLASSNVARNRWPKLFSPRYNAC